jgi:opacity protein-like surface antigen
MWRSFVWGAVLLVSAAAPAMAQVVPERGTMAAGLSIGAALPGDERLDNGFMLGASFERFLSSRVAVRGSLSGAWWNIDGVGIDDSMSPVFVQANLVHHWERGKWRPYATGGLGLYKFRFTEDDIDSSATTLGFNLGGGAEYFFRPEDTVTAELLFHPLVGDVESRFEEYEPWFWSITAGYKKYF